MNHHSYLPAEPLEDRIAPASLVTVAYNVTSGALTLGGDDSDNSVDVFKTGPDTYQIKASDGTMLSAGSDPVPLLNIGKLSSLTINGNGGRDTFTLTDLTALQALKFDGGTGDDFLYSTNLAVKGDVTIKLGAAGGLVAFTGAATVIGGDFKASYGAGGGSVDFFADSTSIKGAVKLVGGAGADAFSFGKVVNVDKGLTVSDVGQGISVAFQNATIVIGKGRGGQAIDFDGGSGDDSLKFVGGNVTLKGGLEFSGGAGADTADLNAASLKVDGSIRLEGGSGDDTLNVLASTLSVSGSLTILGGGGANVSSVFADGLIKGDVNLDMGGADGGGNQTFLIGGISGAVGALKIGRSLNVESDATDPLHHGFTDFLWATDVTVGRDVNIEMGAVDSSVSLDNIFVHGGLNIDTGAGNDTVAIEQAGLTGPSIIGKLASIQLGSGDDVIRIGKSNAAGSNDFVIFKGGLRVNGGPGTDASNDFLNDAVNVFDQSSGDDRHDGNRWEFDDGKFRFVKERLNFEGSFLT